MDVSMCRDYECPLREKCLRYNGTPNRSYQSYFQNSPRKNHVFISDCDDELCEFYVSAKAIDVTELDTLNMQRTEKGYVLEYVEDNLKAGVSVKEEELSNNGWGIPIGGYVEEPTPKEAVMYMIYVVGGKNPTYRHDTIEQAQVEAERLAKLTGKQVIILRSYLEVMVEVKTRMTKY
jgi:hypothetical protein